MRAVGCTVVARNYLSYAQVAGDGWLRFHPGHPFAVLVIDDDEDRPASDAHCRFLSPRAIGISPHELERLRGIYTVQELTCALKPHLLRFLLGEGADAVVYVDSDTDILGSMDHVAELAARSGVALSPNLLEPPPLDGRSPSELELAVVGMYCSGLIAVGSSATEFLNWWMSRSRWDCLFAEAAGMHADQRWLDWVHLYFDHAVIRDPALNVAHWNLHERRLAFTDGLFTVNGAPLRSFHFAGFDPLRPYRVTWYRWEAPFRVDLDDVALARLCRQYADKLRGAGYEERRTLPYRYDRSVAGSRLGLWERRVYREALLAAEARGDGRVPSPFDPSRAAEFERLLTNPRSAGLLSEAALSRLADGRVALNGGGWNRRRITEAVRGRFARGLRAPRAPWMPDPRPGDRTRAGYGRVGR
jgi:hypothetical protein